MTEAAVDFLLEKMMHLLSCESQLIHFDRNQIKCIYEEMQFLRKFLKDLEGWRHEEEDEEKKVKEVVTKIRDLTYRVEDAIDLVLLEKEGSKAYVSRLPFKLPDKMKLMVIDHGYYDHVSVEIESLKAEVTAIYGMISSLSPWAAEKICPGFQRAAAEIDSIRTDVEIYKKEVGIATRRSFTVDDLLSSVQKMLQVAEKIVEAFLCFKDDIHECIRIEEERLSRSAQAEEEIKCAMKGFDFSSLFYVRMCNEVHFVQFLKDIFHDIVRTPRGSLPKELVSVRRETMMRYQEELSRSWLASSMIDKVRDVIGLIVRELKSMYTVIETYRSRSNFLLDNDLLSHPINYAMDEMQSIKKEMKSYENALRLPSDCCIRGWYYGMVNGQHHVCYLGSGIFYFIQRLLGQKMDSETGLRLDHSLIAQEFLLLCNLLESAEKIRDGFSTLMEEMEATPAEVEFHKKAWSPVLPESYPSYNLLKMVYLAKKIHRHFHSFIQESKSFKSNMIIRENRLDNWFVFSVAEQYRLLFRLYQIVDLTHKILKSFSNFREELSSIMADLFGKGTQLGHSGMPTKIYHGFGRIMEEINSIKTEVMKMKFRDVHVQKMSKFSVRTPLLGTSSIAEEMLVGFVDEHTTIVDLLTGDHEKQLKLIQIVGMPGLGKTTLARKVFNDSFIQHHFYVCAWTYVSQAYRKKNTLLAILRSAFQLGDEICEMSDEKLGEELYKQLKCKRFLVVMDDIWSVGVWNDLKRYFPNDNNGSRVMFTSRLTVLDVAHAHHLRFLTENESWILLQHKVFGTECCPPELMEIGKQIARKCGGLPLAIVVLSGLLAKNEKTHNWWSHVSQSVSSYISSDREQYMDTLALSYNHLPHPLKACFLYFGAFPEDYEIPVWKLILLWVAEGFILQNEQRRLEEVAEDYLIDLIDRNLVLVSRKRSNGGIKACRVHDLLRDLCMKKALEENFLGNLCWYEHSSSFSLVRNMQRRLCTQSCIFDPSYLDSYGPWVRSFLSFGHSLDKFSTFDVSIVCQGFQLLKVLDLSSIKILEFPFQISSLLLLRYLALHVDVGELEYFKPSISNLQNLHTLIVDGGPMNLLVLDDFWKMGSLRHLYAKQLIEIPGVPDDGCPSALYNLETITKLDLRGLNEQLLQRIPNLRKLKCFFMESWGENHIFPKLNFLLHLETLNVIYHGFTRCQGRFPHAVEFPPSLKSLTLSNFHLPWEEMSTLARLPNLEVLKLSYKAFEGPSWNMGDVKFAKLKYLRFRGLNIKQWNGSSYHFPMLQTLVLDDCKMLQEIPIGLGDIFTLETIQLWNCNASATNSAKQIQKQQLCLENYGFKIHMHPYHCEAYESDHEDEEDAHCSC